MSFTKNQLTSVCCLASVVLTNRQQQQQRPVKWKLHGADLWRILNYKKTFDGGTFSDGLRVTCRTISISTHSTAACLSTRWGWTPALGSRASTGACVAGNAPSPPPQPPATAAASAAPRPRSRPPPAATGCGRCREGSEPAGRPPPTSSAPPEEPRSRSPASSATWAASHVVPTCPQAQLDRVTCSTSRHVYPRPRPDTKWKETLEQTKRPLQLRTPSQSKPYICDAP